MGQCCSRLAAGAKTARNAINEQAPIVYTFAKELAGTIDPRLKALVAVIEQIHNRCLAAKYNQEQCLALRSFCLDIVVDIDKAVKDGLSLDDKVEHINRLHRLLTQTAMQVQTISTIEPGKAVFNNDTIEARIAQLRIDLTDGLTAFNASSLLALHAHADRFAAAAAADRQRANVMDNKLDDIKEQGQRILDAMASDVRRMQIHGRMQPSGSAEQAAVFTQLRSVLQQTGYPPLPLADFIDEAKKVGDSSVSDGSNNGTLWRGILLDSSDDPKMELALKYPRDQIRLSLNRAMKFQRSVDIQRGLQHRNIISLMGVKYKRAADDTVAIEFVAFPWVKYGNISSFTAKFPDADRLKLMFDVACGLKYLHEQSPSIVHRAIEPNHILVDAEGTAIISSFSVAKALDSVDSTTYTVSDGKQKSLRWMAPEVSEGQCNTPADVYSWAITTLSVFSGVDPFPGLKQPGAVVLAVGRGQRPNREQHQSPFLTDKMWELLERCWHQDPAKRPTMGDVVNEITSAIRPGLSVV